MGCECEKADLEIVKKGMFLGGKIRDFYICKKCKSKHFEITCSQKEDSNMMMNYKEWAKFMLNGHSIENNFEELLSFDKESNAFFIRGMSGENDVTPLEALEFLSDL